MHRAHGLGRHCDVYIYTRVLGLFKQIKIIFFKVCLLRMVFSI